MHGPRPVSGYAVYLPARFAGAYLTASGMSSTGETMSKIVVADDDADIRELVTFILEMEGHEVFPVRDGAAAVAACRDEDPEAVLDFKMPRMSGVDACRALRTDAALAGIPVILLTARTEESDIEHGVNAGADDHVAKPFSPSELAARVAAILERSDA